ncbi:MAG: glucose-6-phosphate isomerase [Nitrospirae bacterium]|nr:glucose-6-phosphate isomerase [Nitrospirota bacterium]
MKGWRDADWQGGMRISYDFNFMMDEYVGRSDGITRAELDALRPRAAKVHEELAGKRKSGALPFFDLPYQDTAAIKALAEEIAATADNFILLGIGGSALGPVALQTALRHPYHNLLTKKARGGRPRMFYPDNVDPDLFAGMMEAIDLKKTVFDVVTKSGGTSETVAHFLLAREAVTKALGKAALREHIVCVTDPEKGNLRKIVKKEKYRALEVPPGVGGRFSVFTPVGLLPAAVSGIDIDELLAGAADMDNRTAKGDVWENPAYMAACLQYLADTKKGKRISVMMAYAHGLRDVADWYRQLWAESLGKKLDLAGRVVHTGQTPVKAVGATDQHSQVQLYMEGPNDKTLTFLRVEKFREEVVMPRAFREMDGVSFLGGKSLAGLINAEQSATELALMKAGRPSARITLPELNAYTLGQLLYMMQVQTAFAGGLYGINPFDQPGVEEGKLLTYAMMDRPGYEEKKKELDAIKKKDGYVI